MGTKAKIGKLYKFKKKWRIKKAKKVVGIINQVINSQGFEKAVLSYQFSDTRFRYAMSDEYKEIEDNKEIYDILMKGNEQASLQRIDDFVWTLNIKLGRFLRQVGRREGNLIITQNWFFKVPNNEEAIAAHWIHEYSHVLGFHHDYEDTVRRKNSVPYGLGSIVKQLLSKSA